VTKEIILSDATKLAELIRTKEVSPVEVVQAHLDRIAAVNPKINAIVTLADGALKAAKAAEAAVLAGDEIGPLHGVPFTVKDSIDTADVATQRGSPIFKGRVPDVDATSVARMKKAGGILLAKTNLPEFSYWIESDNLLSGRTNNPWDVTRTPGGSSGGESAAIAAGMSPIGLGTDLAISVRGPAAQTGITSMKATHGRVPMTGIWPRAPRRFWHVGPMARSVRDIALAFSQLLGPDGQDAFATSTVQFDGGIGRQPYCQLRVGWMVGPGLGPVHPEVAATVKAAAEALKDIGVFVEQVSIPALERDFPLDVFNRLHVMEMKPAFAEATAGHEDEMYKIGQDHALAARHADEGLYRRRAGGRAAARRLCRLLLALRRADYPRAADPGPQAWRRGVHHRRPDRGRHLPPGRDRAAQRHRLARPVDAVRYEQGRAAD